MSLKVLLTTNIPSPYFVDYANELSKYVDLTVTFELQKANDRNNNWQMCANNFKFKHIYLNAIRTSEESGLSFKLKKIIKKQKFDRIIIANPTTPTGIIALMYMRRHNISFIMQSEGGFQSSSKNLKNKIKKYIFKKANFYLTGMGGDDDYFLSYGVTKEKLKKYNFTSLKQKDVIPAPLSKNEKEIIKKDLNLNYKNIVLYVGQFIGRKDIPTLLKAFKDIDNGDTCLVLLGGSITRKYFKIEKELNLKNIIYIPFKNQHTLKQYYKAADIFVLPTKEDTWGLVINEAMAYGLPVISTNKSIAATQLIKNNENGYLVNVGDSIAIHNYILKLLGDDTLRCTIGTNNIKKISDYTIENMTRTIFNYIK